MAQAFVDWGYSGKLSEAARGDKSSMIEEAIKGLDVAQLADMVGCMTKVVTEKRVGELVVKHEEAVHRKLAEAQMSANAAGVRVQNELKEAKEKETSVTQIEASVNAMLLVFRERHAKQ